MATCKVAVLVPSGGMWEAGFGYDLAQMMTWTASSREVDLYLSNARGSILVSNRHDLVEAGQKCESDFFLWLDDDMRFPKDTIFRLLERGKEVVAVNYRNRTRNEKTVTWDDNGPVYTTEESTGLQSVSHAGMGIMMTHKSVFEAMEAPYFMFGWSPQGQNFVGEDVLFCRRVLDAGIEIFIDHDLSKEVRHIGAKEIAHDGQ